MQWSNSFEWLANNESCVVWYFLGLGSSWSSANRTSAFLLITYMLHIATWHIAHMALDLLCYPFDLFVITIDFPYFRLPTSLSISPLALTFSYPEGHEKETTRRALIVRIPTKSIFRLKLSNCGNFLLFSIHFPSVRCSFLGQKDLGSWLNGFFPSFPPKGLHTFFVGQWMKGKIYFPRAAKEKLSKQTNKNITKTGENRKSRKLIPSRFSCNFPPAVQHCSILNFCLGLGTLP